MSLTTALSGPDYSAEHSHLSLPDTLPISSPFAAGKREAKAIDGATVSILIPPNEADFVFPALSAQRPLTVWAHTSELFVSHNLVLRGPDSESVKSHLTVTSLLFQTSPIAA